MTDNRILDFRESNVLLPEKFLEISMRKIILASGDGFRQRNINNELKTITDIEYYTKYTIPKYNIFCLKYDYNSQDYNKNTDYLTSNPDLNIVICLIDFDNKLELDRLCKIFKNSVAYINTDDIRFYIPGKYVHKLLLEQGIADGVVTEKSTYDIKYGFYTPDFLKSNMFINQSPQFRRQYLKTNQCKNDNDCAFYENGKCIDNKCQDNLKEGGAKSKKRRNIKNKKTIRKFFRNKLNNRVRHK
jgi:hypothetical protein